MNPFDHNPAVVVESQFENVVVVVSEFVTVIANAESNAQEFVCQQIETI